jgi:hypothetical protein
VTGEPSWYLQRRMRHSSRLDVPKSIWESSMEQASRAKAAPRSNWNSARIPTALLKVQPFAYHRSSGLTLKAESRASRSPVPMNVTSACTLTGQRKACMQNAVNGPKSILIFGNQVLHLTSPRRMVKWGGHNRLILDLTKLDYSKEEYISCCNVVKFVPNTLMSTRQMGQKKSIPPPPKKRALDETPVLLSTISYITLDLYTISRIEKPRKSGRIQSTWSNAAASISCREPLKNSTSPVLIQSGLSCT